MAIEAKDLPKIFEFVGISDATDVEDFNKKFAQKWHTADSFFESDDFKKHIGKLNGSLVSKSKAIAKQFGIELSGNEIENKKTEEVFETILSKLQESNNAAVEDLKKKAGAGKDEKYTELETKFNNRDRDFKTLEQAHNELKGTLTAKEQEYAAKLKNEKLSFRTKDIFNSIQWGVDDKDPKKVELIKDGFINRFKANVKFDLDENDNLIALDAKTGQKFQNPKQHSTFLSPQELLQKEAIEAGVWKVNPDGGKPAGGWGSGFNQGANSGGGAPPSQPAKRNDLAVTAYNQ